MADSESIEATSPLADRYELEEIIGEGANATTYLATDRETDRRCAVKELRIAEAESFEVIRLFEREASVLEQLGHPGIPGYFDEFRLEDDRGVALCIVQEYVDGSTLEEALSERRWAEPEILELLASILEIADYLHDRSPPVVHRDIKPENVILTGDDDPALVDFGSVRAAVRPDGEGRTITGTVGYMAPEQFAAHAEPATDIYGVAATGVHLLTGRPPSEMLDQTNRLDWEPYAETSEPTAAVLHAMLARDPEERPQDAGEVADWLRGIASQEITDRADLARVAPEIDGSAGGSERSGGSDGESAPPGPPAQSQGGVAARPEREGAAGEPARWSVDEKTPRFLPGDFDQRLCRDTARTESISTGVGAVVVLGGFLAVVVAFNVGSGSFVAILAFLAILVGAGFLAAGYTARRKLRKMREVYRNGAYTVGTVTGSEMDATRRRHRGKIVHYEFEVSRPGEQSLIVEGWTKTEAPKIPARGDPVPVLYDPGEPQDNIGVVDYLS